MGEFLTPEEKLKLENCIRIPISTEKKKTLGWRGGGERCVEGLRGQGAITTGRIQKGVAAPDGCISFFGTCRIEGGEKKVRAGGKPRVPGVLKVLRVRGIWGDRTLFLSRVTERGVGESNSEAAVKKGVFLKLHDLRMEATDKSTRQSRRGFVKNQKRAAKAHRLRRKRRDEK